MKHPLILEPILYGLALQLESCVAVQPRVALGLVSQDL